MGLLHGYFGGDHWLGAEDAVGSATLLLRFFCEHILLLTNREWEKWRTDWGRNGQVNRLNPASQ